MLLANTHHLADDNEMVLLLKFWCSNYLDEKSGSCTSNNQQRRMSVIMFSLIEHFKINENENVMSVTR